MKIEKDKWACIHYTLKDADGVELDSSIGKEPLGYLHGNGYLISGLEAELEGKEPGAKFTAVIPAKDAYGEYDEQLKIDVPRDNFDTDQEISVGMMFQVMTPGGPSIVRVVEVGTDKIKIDANHELAGKELHFDVEVVEVREPTEEDLAPRCSGNCGNCGSDCEGGCDGECDCDGQCNCDGECQNN